jgi:hypothetical protein
MTSIGKPDGGPVDQWAGGFSTRDGFDGKRGDVGGRGDGLGRGLGLGIADTLAGGERAALFEKSFRAAVHGLRDDKGDDPWRDDIMAQARLLAAAEAPVGTGLPSPADATPSAPVAPALEAVVATVTERIEQSIRAELAPTAARPLDLRLTFPDGLAGLAGLRLIVTPTSLDVIFERTGQDELSTELIGAAAALADRLRTRFSKRSVRIMDMPGGEAAADAAPADGGVRTLSDLFRQG